MNLKELGISEAKMIYSIILELFKYAVSTADIIWRRSECEGQAVVEIGMKKRQLGELNLG
jgi:hypothetical protein